MKLSDKLRPSSEASPWVIEQVKKLEAELDEARDEATAALRRAAWAEAQIAKASDAQAAQEEWEEWEAGPWEETSVEFLIRKSAAASSLRAEAERLRTERTTLLCGEGCSLTGILDGQDGVSRCAEHDKRLQTALRTVAERQRLACANYLRHWAYDDHALSRVRATPLVTEGDK